jgi:hypothetical protein
MTAQAFLFHSRSGISARDALSEVGKAIFQWRIVAAARH